MNTIALKRTIRWIIFTSIIFAFGGESIAATPTGNGGNQYRSDTGAAIPFTTGTIPTGVGVYFEANVADADGNTIKLEVELRKLPASFTGVATHSSGFASSGTRARTSTATGLTSGNYGWRFRVIDSTGAATGWVAAGNPDFIVQGGNQTPTSGLANQYRTDTGAAIPLGTAIPTGVGVNFKSTLSDADGDTVKLEVELRQLPASFTGTPTHSSGFVNSGSQATTATASGLAAGNWGWRYRVIDSRGAASGWSSVGNPDFIVQGVNQTPTSGLANQYRTDTGAAIPLGTAIPTGVGVNFKSTVSDADGDTVKLEVELRQLPASFTGVPTHSSGFVNSGSQATTATASGLAVGNWGWRYRVVDDRGAVGGWSSVGNPDFIVQGVNQTPTSGLANQYRTDTGAAIPLGTAIPTDVGVNFKSTVSDPDGDTVKLEIELRRLPASFTGTPTHSSGFVNSGSQATTATASGLAEGNWGWRYRVVDNRGAVGGWSSVGDPDFIVQGVNHTPTSGLANQFRTDTGVAIPLGTAIPTDVGVNFKSTVSDSDGDTVKLEVELRQLPASFTGTPTHSSGFVNSGSQATTVTASGLAPGNWGWRYRVIDDRGAAGGWSSVGNPDFIVQGVNHTPTSGLANQFRTDTGVAIPLGTAIPTDVGVNFKSTVSDSDGDTVKLEVELRQLPASFTGTPTHSSGFVNSGSQATTATASGLAPGNWGWRYRVIDDRGAAGNWSSVGNPDFIVQSVENRMPTFTLANQYRADNETAIPLKGGIVPSGVGVYFAANVADADGDNVKFEVELRKLPASFTGVPTHTSAFVGSGTKAKTDSANGLSQGNYGWKFRIVDSRGAVRNWSSAGNPDFIVQSTGVVPTIVSVSPASPIGSSTRQSFTINGSNFESGASVRLRDITANQTFPDRPISSQSSSHITINPIFGSAAHDWTVEVINPNASSTPFPFTVRVPQSVSLSVLSPVPGKFRVTGIENSDCGGVAELWTFCQHQSGFHVVGGGIADADDTFAWDINLLGDADNGKTVFAAAPGRVVAYAGLHAPGAVSGGVLIEHTRDGITWWSGYLHMKEIKVSLNQDVTPSTELGKISDVCACGNIPNHLHFVAYEGSNIQGGLRSRQVQFIERPQFVEIGKTGTPFQENGEFQIGIAAPLQDAVLVQGTEDFKTWTDFPIVSITDGKGVFSDPNAGSKTMRFYFPKPDAPAGAAAAAKAPSTTVSGK